jgi:predicted GIY-YIG superfamily endonuclease
MTTDQSTITISDDELSTSDEEYLVGDDEDVEEKKYGCYLLLSLNKKEYKKNLARRWTYIGSTYDFDRRINQHNGFKSGGAKKTKKGSHRPLVVVCTVTGFDCRKDALEFEWAWQHPARTRYLKKVRSERREQGKTKLPQHGSNLKFALTGLKALRQIWVQNDLQVEWYSNEVLQVYNSIK